MRIESATAMRIPSSTPKKITPSVAVSMSTKDDFRIRKNLAAAVTSIRDSAAAMTIAASAELGRFASKSGSRTSITTHERGAHEACHLALGAALLRDGRAGAAGRDREPLEQPGERVGGADSDHLLARVHLVAAPGGEARRGRDRVGERDERDPDRGGEQRAHVAEVDRGDLRVAGTLVAASPPS